MQVLEKQVSNVGEVVNAMAALKLGEEEQTRLERTLGRALLAKMRGDNVDLQEIYRNLGGSDPVVEIVLDSRLLAGCIMVCGRRGGRQSPEIQRRFRRLLQKARHQHGRPIEQG